MGPRTRAILALLLFFIVAVAVVGLNTRTGADANVPLPPSTYLSGPTGASAVAEALERMGVRVDRWRRTYRMFPTFDTLSPAPLFVVLGPSGGLQATEALALRDRARSRGPVLLAGPGATPAMHCFGWSAIPRGADSIAVRAPGTATSPKAGWVHWVLVASTRDTVVVDRETKYAGVVKSPCNAEVISADTLLETAGRRPVLVRVEMAKGYPVYLLSDPELLSNAVLRRSDAGPGLLRLLATAGAGVRFDEYHHGFDEGGDLLGAVVAWSESSPWGWGVWQLVVVGILALLAAMPRSGPVYQAIRRTRRSPLEHVRALATALRSARGHDVAVELLVRGLRRRLSRTGRPGREPVAAWLAHLQDRVRTPRARAAAARLGALTRPGRSAVDVLAAANAVEDVWQELRP
ncbi:MAG TPA: DUF4350 domain-containing protein [Gemmatimonadales bacterium]|nr:DUF4350 domain-containing protein [Gemmatimonadales bacterium]